MVNQKQISFKINLGILQELDKEVALGYRKRNSIINKALIMYLDMCDVRRRHPSDEDMMQFCLRWFPTAGF